MGCFYYGTLAFLTLSLCMKLVGQFFTMLEVKTSSVVLVGYYYYYFMIVQLFATTYIYLLYQFYFQVWGSQAFGIWDSTNRVGEVFIDIKNIWMCVEKCEAFWFDYPIVRGTVKNGFNSMFASEFMPCCSTKCIKACLRWLTRVRGLYAYGAGKKGLYWV